MKFKLLSNVINTKQHYFLFKNSIKDKYSIYQKGLKYLKKNRSIIKSKCRAIHKCKAKKIHFIIVRVNDMLWKMYEKNKRCTCWCRRAIATLHLIYSDIFAYSFVNKLYQNKQTYLSDDVKNVSMSMTVWFRVTFQKLFFSFYFPFFSFSNVQWFNFFS